MRKVSKRQAAYLANKQAKVGENITCPVCGSAFTKKQYSQAFCCGKCKDTYWNAKGDRHAVGYYEEYDAKSVERTMRRRLYGSNIVVPIGGGLTPRQLEDIERRFLETKQEIEEFDEDGIPKVTLSDECKEEVFDLDYRCSDYGDAMEFFGHSK